VRRIAMHRTRRLVSSALRRARPLQTFERMPIPWSRHRWTTGVALVVVAAVTILATIASAQRWVRIEPNVAYDARFTFVRLRYQVYGRSGWEFDYPQMERNFMTILDDMTSIAPHTRESNVLDMDDPELLKYPVAYLSEPGAWLPDSAEAAGLRTWLAKGGFLIVDDFYGRQWENFERSMRRVLPAARIVPMELSHPVFDAFFRIGTLEGMRHPSVSGYPAQYLGIFEDNDPARRLQVIINYNNDIGDYMEWSGEGWYPVNLSNDAYKLATNYIVYGLTH